MATAGAVLLCTGVGAGAGAVLITSGLATVGSLVGGGMLAGIGVLACGSATVAALAGAISHKVIKDPELRRLAERLKNANELFEVSKRVTEAQKLEIEELNRQVGELLRAKKRDHDRLDELKARLIVLIRQMQGAA